MRGKREVNLYCSFHTENTLLSGNEEEKWKTCRTFTPKFFGPNVRRNSPQPSICVRTLSPITKRQLRRDLIQRANTLIPQNASPVPHTAAIMSILVLLCGITFSGQPKPDELTISRVLSHFFREE